MRYLVDTDACTLTLLPGFTFTELLHVRKLLRTTYKGYALEIGGEPQAQVFNAPVYPDVSIETPHMRRPIGFKVQHGEG